MRTAHEVQQEIDKLTDILQHRRYIGGKESDVLTAVGGLLWVIGREDIPLSMSIMGDLSE